MRARLVAPLLLAVATSATAVVNVGQDASGPSFVACNGRAAFATVEALQGLTDLNGDADILDTVLQIVALGSGVVTNVGIDASGPLACGGNRFAFGVSESAEAADLNGDGDQIDTVLHVYDAATATLTNVGRAVTAVAMSSAIAAFTVPEAFEGPGGTDLNGDGDTADQVLHVVDLTTLAVANTGQEAGASSAAALIVRGDAVAFVTNEAAQGGTSLNGDLDTVDDVVQVYDASSATSTSTLRAMLPNPSGSTSIAFNGNVVAFVVSEVGQGGVSLNGDLDVGDKVLHFFCLPGAPCPFPGTTTSLALDAGGGFALGTDLLAFGVRERGQGTNLNAGVGDLDLSDVVLHVYRLSTGILTNTGLASEGAMQVADPFVAFVVPERRQNATSLNGDVDHKDLVMHLWNATSATAVNLQRAVYKSCPKQTTAKKPRGPCFALGGDALLFAVPENGQSVTNLNGDVDLNDLVVASYRPSTGSGTSVSTGLAMDKSRALVAAGTLGGFLASEKRQGGSSLNGDGDGRDLVAVTVDVTSGLATVSGQAGDQVLILEAGRLVFRTHEADQSADLNLDGDRFDNVLQYQ